MAALLKKAREGANLTVRQMAARLGCSHSQIVKVETESRRISVGELVMWCEAADVDAVEMLRECLG